MLQERPLLGQLLERKKVVSAQQIRDALKEQEAAPDRKIGEILVARGWATGAQVAQALAEQFEMPFVDLRTLEIDPEVIGSVPPQVAEDNKIVPVKKNGRVITVAVGDPLETFIIADNLRFILNMDVECVLADRDDLKDAINRYYGAGAKSAIGNVLEELTQSEITVRGAEEGQAAPEEDDAPVIRYVSLIITEAVKARASDIHVEPMEKKLRIRYRVDGVCREVDSPPKRLQGPILARIKIMADMDIAEKRKPQDGRIKITAAGKELDLRVSALPATHGESIVMRILDKQSGLVGLDELGFHPDDYKRFQAIIKRPNGIFLVTGPTGSGKTTTLYAALRELNRPDVKIITAENPVEYVLPGVNQSQVKPQIGMTFARIIRAMLRQAPNIILVGEIRDTETAEIAIQAALTGHLVFSTLHTNDAASAITRLIDMGVKPFLVASSIQAVMAQRLVRVLCPHCKEPYEAEDHELAALGVKREELHGRPLYRPKGCEKCDNQGYKGRKGIFELMEMNNLLRELAFKKAPTLRIREVARQNGMLTLQEDGVRKVIDGLTSVAELLSMTHREDLNY